VLWCRMGGFNRCYGVEWEGLIGVVGVEWEGLIGRYEIIYVCMR
jgi:hypothetical protein